MNSGAEEGFIGINVAQSTEEALVQQQRLDAGLAALEGGGEILERDLQRLGPEFCNPRGEFLAELDAAELAAVVIEQDTAVERQDGVGVLARRAIEQEAAGHAEMNDQVSAAIERYQDELSIAPDAGDSAAPDARRHGMRIAAAQHAPAAEFGGHNTAPHQRRNGAHDGFDFGKLGHPGTGYLPSLTCWLRNRSYPISLIWWSCASSQSTWPSSIFRRRSNSSREALSASFPDTWMARLYMATALISSFRSLSIWACTFCPTVSCIASVMVGVASRKRSRSISASACFISSMDVFLICSPSRS